MRAHRSRQRMGVVGAGLGLALLAWGSVAQADQCCWMVDQSGWVYSSGRYTNAGNGDAVVLATRPDGILRPIMDALGEQHDHVAMVESYDGYYLSQSEGDGSKVTTTSNVTHPISGGLQPMYQSNSGWNHMTSADWAGQLRGYPTSMVLHGAAPNRTPYYGAGCGPTPAGYSLAGFSRNVTNGQCVQYLMDSCSMARPSARYYAAYTVNIAANAMYNAIHAKAVAIGQPWYASLIYGDEAFRHAANQVVNAFVYNNWWDQLGQYWSVPITDVVTPTQLAASYPGAKEPLTYVAGYYYWTTWSTFMCDWGQDKGCGAGSNGSYHNCQCGAGPFCPPGAGCAHPL
jgi:hypothetical protein